ncbi:hypothetical protein [Aneurinibacillus tyrosinisolvens]|uniref:hypothetical protein n=1 Tax=Aneurinibacillus tyrosinisolvens TaxID=1443435 RepID=UPI00063F003F|nr:hypothetical protein [Aneurinibacillus tyrosinisolvens]
MVKQFLRRVFSPRKVEEDTEELLPSRQESEETLSIPKDTGRVLEEIRAELLQEEKEEQPFTLLITREKIDHHNYKEAVGLVSEIMEEIQEGTRRFARIQLKIDQELSVLQDEFLGRRIGKYIDAIERETYDATALLDWHHEETVSIYQTFVMPAQIQKQDAFIQSRVLMLHDTCADMGWDYRELSKRFASSLGFILADDYFDSFEEWLDKMERMPEAAAEDALAPEKEESSQDITSFLISREEVEQEDIGQIASFLDGLIADKQNIAARKGSVVFSFYGFSGEVEDLMMNPAVTAWASYLVERYPYLFYFLNDSHVPMTRFVTSMVVSAQMHGDQILFDQEELQEFLGYIQGALENFSEWVHEDAEILKAEFAAKLST